ncbi:MAG: polysaccharide biosynthesis tyrosine autokinase [Rhodospirillaceae bacterium]|nr:polysaccharide biosynthesis tyrosine autokinase [Rhodospirillaceae bacterium]
MTLFQNSLAPAPPDVFRRRVRWALGVVRRGKWVVFGCVLLITAPTVVYLYTAKRLYSTTAEVLIESPDTGDSLLDRSYGRSRLTEAAIQTEADILSSSSLAARVIEKLNLTADPEFNTALRPRSLWGKILPYINPLPFLTGQRAGEQQLTEQGRAKLAMTRIQGNFLSRLSVKSRRRSFVITVGFTAENGEKAGRIANTLADLYVVDRLEANLQESRRANEWLAHRLEGLRHDVAIGERTAEAFRITHNLTQRRKGERLMTISDQQLIELNSRLVLARTDLAQKRARYEQTLALSRRSGSTETSFDVLQSSLIQRLREQEAITQRELSEATKTYGDRHPRIIGQRADLNELRQKIAQEVNKITASLASEVAAAQAGVTTMEREIAALKRTTNEAGSDEVELRELERQADTSRTLYESFMARYKRDTGQERIQRANARVLSQAVIPVQPSSPRRIRIFVGAVFVSVLAGLGLVFLLDRLNGRVRSPEEAEQITGLPILASIPYYGNKNQSREALDYASLDAPRSNLANAFRSLRAVLSANTETGADKVTLTTSSVPQEGKSFVSRHLAMTIAKAGHRVLLIDADLMRPIQHTAMGLTPDRGLAQLLLEPTLPVDDLLLHDERGSFDILPAGPIDLESGNALANGRLEEIVQSLATRYDRIVIDAPPCLAATDAQILARVADQIVLVIKWNHTARDAVLTALSYLSKVGAKVSGVVLTQTQDNLDGTYGSYGYYGNYDGYSEKS